MYRHTDRSSGICDTSGDRLTDPPCRIGTELITFGIVKLVNGFHQSHISFLDQIQKRHSTTDIFFGNADYQTKIGFRQLFLCFFISCFHTLCKLYLLLGGQQRHVSDLFQIHTHRIFCADTFQHVHIIDDLNLVLVIQNDIIIVEDQIFCIVHANFGIYNINLLLFQILQYQIHLIFGKFQPFKGIINLTVL